MSKKIPEFLKINEKKVCTKIIDFIKFYVDSADADGVVVGLSGGVDSSVAARVAIEALGKQRVLALILPEKESNPVDIGDALELAQELKLNYKKLDITKPVVEILKLGGDEYKTAPKIAKGNVKARIRMVTLYYYANKMNRLVLGTGDKSEILLGYFTKYGDGGVDILPLGDLFKTQVRLLAEYLGIPNKIAWKPSSPGLWPGHKAVDELGASYEVIDQILYLYEKGYNVDRIVKDLNISISLVMDVFKAIEKGKHKRALPPICKIFT